MMDLTLLCVHKFYICLYTVVPAEVCNCQCNSVFLQHQCFSELKQQSLKSFIKGKWQMFTGFSFSDVRLCCLRCKTQQGVPFYYISLHSIQLWMGLQWSANKPLYEIKIRGWSSYFCIDFLISLSCFHINFWNMQYFLYLARLKVLPGPCTTKWVQHTPGISPISEFSYPYAW